jgi:hypothetical protein
LSPQTLGGLASRDVPLLSWFNGKWGTQSAFLGCGVLFESLYAFLLRFKGFNQDINQPHSYRSILSPSANMPLFLLQFVSVLSTSDLSSWMSI